MKPFTRVAALVFALVALAHIIRLIYGLDIKIGGVDIPLWLSAVGAVISAGLSVMLWRESYGDAE